MLGEAWDARLLLPDVQTVMDSRVCPRSGHDHFQNRWGGWRAMLLPWADCLRDSLQTVSAQLWSSENF